MKTALLQYHFDSVLNLLKTILEKNGFGISMMNYEDGTIKAKSKKTLFKKPRILEMKVFRIANNATRIDLSINSNHSLYDTARTPEELMEEEILDIIYRYF